MNGNNDDPNAIQRQTITLPPIVYQRLQYFRFTRQYENKTKAILAVLNAGLDALGVPANPPPPPPRKAAALIARKTRKR